MNQNCEEKAKTYKKEIQLFLYSKWISTREIEIIYSRDHSRTDMRGHMWHTYVYTFIVHKYIYTMHIYMYEMKMLWMQKTSETDLNEPSKWLISFIVYKYTEEFTKLQKLSLY